MSIYFRKKIPTHFYRELAASCLGTWLEETANATIFGPSGTGKSEFLDEYFSPERCAQLARRAENPVVVLCWMGDDLVRMHDALEMEYCAYREAADYLSVLGLPCPDSMIPPDSLEKVSARAMRMVRMGWKTNGYRILLTIKKFNRFVCTLGEEKTGRAAQLDILNVRDLPMIVTNDYVYTSQYCPAIEQVRGSTIFNDLVNNTLRMTTLHPTAQAFAAYLQAIFLGDGTPFTQEETNWLLEMTGGCIAFIPDMADALYEERLKGLSGESAYAACVQKCLVPEHPVARRIHDLWLGDLKPAEYDALAALTLGGRGNNRGLPEVDRGLFDLSHKGYLCNGILREYLQAYPVSENAAPEPQPQENDLLGLGAKGNYVIQNCTFVQGNVNMVNATVEPVFWHQMLQNLSQVASGHANAIELVGHQLEQLPRPAADASPEQIEEWASDAGKSLSESMQDGMSDLDDVFTRVYAQRMDIYPQNLVEMSKRLPNGSAQIIKQAIVVEDMFDRLVHMINGGTELDYSPCALLYGILLEERLREVLVPFYRADPVLREKPVNLSNKKKQKPWARIDPKHVTIGDVYGGRGNPTYYNQLFQLAQQQQFAQDLNWWRQFFQKLTEAGELRNDTAHATRMNATQTNHLRNMVLGNGTVGKGLLNQINLCCVLDAKLNYHPLAQLGVASEWKDAEKIQQYAIFPRQEKSQTAR